MNKKTYMFVPKKEIRNCKFLAEYYLKLTYKHDKKAIKFLEKYIWLCNKYILKEND